MRAKKKLLLIFSMFTVVLLICTTVFVTCAIGEPSPNPSVSVKTGFSSGSYTPGLYNQQQCASGQILPTVTHSEDDFLFYYATSEYSYGISKDGYETFSFLEPDGTVLEALRGGGTFLIADLNMQMFTKSDKHVSRHEVVSPNCINVYYYTEGGTQFTQYTFHDNNVEVSAHVAFPYEVSNLAGIHLDRTFINGYISHEKKATADWVFPGNNDFPYRTFDSYVLTNHIDSNHKVYSFWRGDNANPLYATEYLSDHNFQVPQLPDSLSSYEINYSLVFENLTKDADADYFALFKGKNSELAVGITPKHAVKSNTTLFDTKDVSFNINVSNLHNSDVQYNIKYCIYDYYGNKYLDMKEARTLPITSQANYSLTPSFEKNGIYYLETTVSHSGKEYRELYPFIVYEHHDYKYTTTSPFGVSGVRFDTYFPNDDTVFLAKEMGIANMRVCISLPDYTGTDYALLQNYLAKLHSNGTKVTGQYLLASDWTVPDNTTRYASELSTILSKISPYLSNCEVGNENNLAYGYLGMDNAMKSYLRKQFNPTEAVITSKYKLPIISSGIYQCQTDWLEAAVANGLWKKLTILSTHGYSFPYSPDLVNDPSVEHSYESGLVRIRNFMNKYGEKTWYMSEFGYPTTPGNATGMFSGADLRSQADYTIREFILGLSYGVDILQPYCFYDGMNTTKGMSDDNCEFHYGMFYAQDYYGRVMPKPLVMSYITMTQLLDGYASCSEAKNISSTARVFELALQQSENPIYVCWSNKSPLTTDTFYSFSRTPGLPWENQWKSGEKLTFSTETYVEVIDSQGNSTLYYPTNGTVSVPITGEPVYIMNATLPKNK